MFCGSDQPENFPVPIINIEPHRAELLFHLRRNDVQSGGFEVRGDGLAKAINQVHPAITALETPERK